MTEVYGYHTPLGDAFREEKKETIEWLLINKAENPIHNIICALRYGNCKGGFELIEKHRIGFIQNFQFRVETRSFIILFFKNHQFGVFWSIVLFLNYEPS